MSIDFLSWFIGLLDGEGSFIIRSQLDKRTNRKYCSCWVAIGLRDDDLPVLEKIQEYLGMGGIYYQINRNQDGRECPVVMWKVTAINDLIHLTKIFDENPLQSRKREDYEIWRKAIFEINKGRSKGGSSPKTYNVEYIEYLIDELKKLRCRDFSS